MHTPLRAAIVLAALASAPAASSQPSPPATSQTAAQARFDRGRALYDQQNFSAALVEFREALASYRSPNIRIYLGLCLAQTGHLAEGYTEVSRALTEAANLSATDRHYAPTEARARYELERLEPRIARVSVRVNHPPEGTVLRVGGVEVGSSAWGVPMPFDPGEIAVVAEAPGFASYQQTVHAEAGAHPAIEVELVPLRAAPQTHVPRLVSSVGAGGAPRVSTGGEDLVTVRVGGGVRVLGLVLGALGLAATGAFVGFGALASSRFETLQRECNFRPCSASRIPEIDSGQQTQTYANVSLGVGLGAILVGAVMVAVGGSSEERRPAPRPMVTLRIDPNHGAVGLAGVF